LENIHLKLNISGRRKIRGDNIPSSEVSWNLKCKMREWIENRNTNGAVVIVTELT
jgi:hypothetical protein